MPKTLTEKKNQAILLEVSRDLKSIISETTKHFVMASGDI